MCTVRKNPDDPSEAAREVLRLIAGQYFGERALLTSAPRAANVIAQVWHGFRGKRGSCCREGGGCCGEGAGDAQVR